MSAIYIIKRHTHEPLRDFSIISNIYAAAAAAAKSLQSCPTLCDPIDGSLPGSTIHGIFQARVLEWGAIAFSVKYIYTYILKILLLYIIFLALLVYLYRNTYVYAHHKTIYLYQW